MLLNLLRDYSVTPLYCHTVILFTLSSLLLLYQLSNLSDIDIRQLTRELEKLIGETVFVLSEDLGYKLRS